MFGFILKKPLALSCAVFLSALLALVFHPILYAALITKLLFGVLLTGIVLFCFIKRNRFRRALFIILLFLSAISLAFLLAVNLNTQRQTLQNNYHKKETFGRFLVTSATHSESFSEFEGVFLLLDEEEVQINGSLVTFNRAFSALPGDLLEGEFMLETTEGDSFLNKQQMASGKFLQGEADYVELVAEGVNTPAVRLAAIRRYVAGTLDEHLSEEGAGMAKALLLADKSDIPTEVKDGFSALGIQHLFAVSGLHLSILIGSIASLLSYMAIRRRFAFPLLIVITLFYMALTGFAPSVLRSGGMLLLFYFSFFSHRHRESVTALLAATTVIVLISPASILDAGLLLSFAATLGILLVANPILTKLFQKRFFQQKRSLAALFAYAVKTTVSSLALSLSATAFILPILYAMNSKVVFFTFLSNLVFTPFFTLLLGCVPVLFLCLFFPVLIPLLTWFVNLLSKAVYALATVSHGFAALSFSLNYAFIPILILLLYIALAVLIAKKKHNLLPLALILLFFITANVGIFINDRVCSQEKTVYYHTNETSDALLLSHGNKGMVIDFSYSSVFILESFEIIESEFPSVTADTLMLTNCRATHTKAVKTLVARNLLKHLFLPKGSKNAEKLYLFAQNEGVDVQYYTPKDTVCWNDIPLTTHPDKTYYNVSAVEIALTNKTLLYLKENAPTISDIRFDVLSKRYDVIFYGAFGLEAKYSSCPFKADVVVQGNTGDYFEENEEIIPYRGDYLVKDTKK